jgi:hypothetical protein
MMSAKFNAQYYWQTKYDQDKVRRRSSRADAYQHMLDSSLWQTAFNNLANHSSCCPSDAIESAITEMNLRFDNENVVTFRKRK